MAQPAHLIQLVADQKHGAAALRDFADLAETFLLKCRVANCEHLVYDEHFRVQMRRHGKCEPHLHAARIVFDRGVDEALDFGKGDDLVELAIDVAPLHAENRAVEKHILAAAQLGMKAGPDFEQGSDEAANRDVPFSRSRNPRQHFQQRALTGAIASDDSNHFTLRDVERNVAQGPDAIVGRLALRAAVPQTSEPTHRRV